MKTVAIIQARMGSTRLPNKVLADIHGQPMLKILLSRIYSIVELNEIVIATTTSKKDDILEEWANLEGVQCFRGSEDDVLSRYFFCALKYNADIVVRLTADDPLKDPIIIKQILAQVIENPNLDYCSNTIKVTYPEGLDVEVFRMSALRCAYQEASLPSEREHVTPFIWKNPDKFSLSSIEFDRDLSDWRWTVDKPEDLEFIRLLLGRFNNFDKVSYLEIIAELENNPNLLKVNTLSTVRNEGYLNSLILEKK